MASAQQISSYYASFGFRIDQSSITKLKTAIKDVKEHISKQLSISVKITKFSIGKRELNAAIKDAAAQASGIRLSINSFAVNATELRKSVQSAFDKGVTLRVNATTRTKDPAATRPRSQGGNTYGTTGGVLNRYGISGLAGYATGVGVMNVNSVSEDLQSSKVSLNTITGGRGVDAYQWIKNQGNQVGFDYRNQLPVFSSYLGASINKQGYDASLESYKNLTQYGLTHGSDRVSLERAMLAIGQMWSKGKIQQEELSQQLAEAKGFSGVKSIIAESYQESIGGKLTGQKAEAALLEAMKKGLVETAKVMPIVTNRLGIQAAGGLEAYNLTTGAQHNRFTNALTNAVEVFGKGGFDEGMMRFFKFMADFLEKHSEGIRDLGGSFLNLEKVFEKMVNTGERVAKFFAGMNPTFTSMGIILSPLLGIMSKFQFALFGIGLAMDDIDTYMEGGDSMIGRFVSYMKDLTGMDISSLGVAFTALGIGLAAAFSPLIAGMISVAALIEAYKYVQTLGSKELPVATGKGAPTLEEMVNFSKIGFATVATNQKGAGKITAGLASITNNLTGGYLGVGMGAIAGSWAPSEGLTSILAAARDSGAIGQGEANRYMAGIGLGIMSEDEAKSRAFDQMLSKNFPASAAVSAPPQPINVTIQGTVSDQTFKIDTAMTHFPNGRQVPTPIGGSK